LSPLGGWPSASTDNQEASVGKEDRGFASMNPDKQREIASKGGKVAHEKGRAHQWSREEAREAGRKGGLSTHQRRQEGPVAS
jgi:hypothetical protein